MSIEPKPLADSDLDQVSGGMTFAKMTSSLLFIPKTSTTTTTTTPTMPPESPTVQGSTSPLSSPASFPGIS